MAKVARYQGGTLPPGFSGVAGPRNIAEQTQHYAAVAGLGQSITNMAFRFSDAFAERKDLTDLTNATTQMYQGFSDLEREFEGDQDYATIEQRWNARVKEMTRDIEDKSWSPRIKQIIQGRFGRAQLQYGDRMARVVEGKELDAGRAAYEMQLDTILKEFVDDPEAAQIAAKEIISEHLNAGHIDRQKAQDDESSILARLDANYILARADEGEYREARKAIEQSKNLMLEDKRKLTANVNSLEAQRKRIESEGRKLLIEQNERQILSDFWDGKVVDPSVLSEMLRTDQISMEFAKSMRKTIMTEEEPEYDPVKHAEGLDIINNMVLTSGEPKEGLDELMEKVVPNVDKTTGKQLVDSLYAEHDKGQVEMLKRGRSQMDKIILDEDIFGMLRGNTEQYKASASAYLQLDQEIQKAAETGKPLAGRDIFIRAVEIGIATRERLEELGVVEPDTEAKFDLNLSKYAERKGELLPRIQRVLKNSKDVMKLSETLPTLSEQEQDKIRAIIRSGRYTAGEILDVINNR